jgi:L-alanine-DL-glutamate epimerase-like enolase superfamily enzyme
MKITGYETTAVRVPYEQAISGSHVILKLRTEGLEGVSYVSRVGPAAMKPLLAVLEGYLEQIVGADPLSHEAVYARVFRRGGGLPGFEARAFSSIDVALWDLKGKAAGQAAYRLMGGHRDRVPCYASWRIEPHDNLEETAQSASYLLDQGFKAMKFHTGPMDAAGVVEHMRVLRQTVGEEVDIMVDVNQRWSVKQAINMAQALAPYDPYWIEDPVSLDDYDGLRLVRESVETRICAGEVYRSIGPFRHLLERRSVDIAMIDLDVGLTGFLKVAHLAEAYEVPVVTHLATEILAHGVAAVPNGLTVEYYPWAVPMLQEPLRLEEGELVLPQRPGLGLELDEAAVAKHRLE